jgi:hypothetical protein
MRTHISLSLAVLTGLVVSSRVSADDAASPNVEVTTRTYAARQLDDEGRLGEALPLYAERARQTVTVADRLRYAGALLRARRPAEARAIFDQLVREEGSIEHGSGQRVRTPAACASTALAAGAPAVAVAYARAAADADRHDPGMRLLLVRALAAADDAAGARALLKTLAPEADDLSDGRRIELGRWQLVTGDAAAARAVVARKPPESVAQMFQDSAQAHQLLVHRNWTKAAELLRASERKVPAGLDDERVDQSWRNAQRELRWVRLRRAVALWLDGNRRDAVVEAEKAQRSDEEYVRSTAVLLLASGALAAGQRDDALARLKVLAGHDYRFAEPALHLATALEAGRDPRDAVGELRAAIASEDHSAEAITGPLLDAFTDAARSSAPAAPGPVEAAR